LIYLFYNIFIVTNASTKAAFNQLIIISASRCFFVISTSIKQIVHVYLLFQISSFMQNFGSYPCLCTRGGQPSCSLVIQHQRVTQSVKQFGWRKSSISVYLPGHRILRRLAQFIHGGTRDHDQCALQPLAFDRHTISFLNQPPFPFSPSTAAFKKGQQMIIGCFVCGFLSP
jgi:hypothetical protein